jgi:glucosamine--fructose-6-phosphate aminotransferase (isomerizing)
VCGIIGIIAKGAVADGLFEGLRRLEYRGYDSAGIVTLVDGHIEWRRAEGKLVNLAKWLHCEPTHGAIGVGHTRWATLGLPTEANAHSIVHNGIIENFRALRDELTALGYTFRAETDTEAVAIMATHCLAQGLAPRDPAGRGYCSRRVEFFRRPWSINERSGTAAALDPEGGNRQSAMKIKNVFLCS